MPTITDSRVRMFCKLVVGGSACALEGLAWALKWAWYPVWFLLKWLLGLDFAEIAPGAPAVIRDVATLYGFILTYGVALALSVQQGVSNRAMAIWLYLLISGVTMTAMVFILRAKGKPGTGQEGPVHVVDKGTLVFTRFILVASLVIVSVFTMLAYQNLLPGQGFDVPAEPRLGMPRAFNYENEVPGIRIPVILGKEVYKDHIPSKLNMEIVLEDSFKQDWKVDFVEGFVGRDPKTTPMLPPPSPYEADDGEGDVSLWFLNDLSPDATYTLRIKLQARRKDVDKARAMKMIQHEKTLQVRFYSRK